MANIMRAFPFISGSVMTLNFALFWAIPIIGMGQLWKLGMNKLLVPMFTLLDENKTLRSFSEEYVYTKPRHSDFFVTSLLLVANAVISFVLVLWWQITYGYLPWWIICLYYCSWVGFGGRTMGSAYTMAHKEGHSHNLYKRTFKSLVGNIFENQLGVLFGNVPWNFTTSHVFIHHKLNGGIGDSFYTWDIDRSNFAHFMLYVHRIFLHMIGYSSIKFFNAQNDSTRSSLLWRGVVKYWIIAFILLVLTKSFSFLFWIYLQPLLCMSYFLALLNIGFHGFIEFDDNGEHVACVNSTCIIEGDDDSFGEDDHMAHHYNSNVYYKDLPLHQQSKIVEFTKYKASVFRKLSIVELSIFILFGLWDKLAEHYVDYSGNMSAEEIKDLLKRRATTIECTNEDYENYLSNPTAEARKRLRCSASEDKRTK